MSKRKVAAELMDLVRWEEKCSHHLSTADAIVALRQARALLAVARAAERAHAFCPTFETCQTCRALARLKKAGAR